VTLVNRFWREQAPLVLASGSPARRALLEGVGIPLEIIKPDVDEAPIAQALSARAAPPAAIAAALALAKGEAVSRAHPHRIVLAADQTLEFRGQLGMKAPTIEAARLQLLSLRGETHHLHSAAVLMQGGAPLWQGCASANLTMRPFSEGFLAHYLAQMGDKVLGTVGCYELEALGPHLFSRIEGEHATILGLPLLGVLDALRARGALLD
jgi:septum formation protein